MNNTVIPSGIFGQWTDGKEHKCKYSCLTTINDYEFKKGEWIELNAPVQPPCDIIEVECFKEKVEKAVYNNLYYQIYRPPMGVFQTSTLKTIAVQQESTKKYQQESLKSKRERKRLCMPNAFAFLFGRQMEPLPKSRYKKKGVVNWPGCTGFITQPTDHYMRPFQIRVEMDKNTFETTHCREHYLFLLEYLQQFLEVYKNEQQKFTMTWIIELTHNYLNTLYHADDTFYKWFKDTHDKMEDSFIFL
uniref:Uncharacterized protein n=1 Tax=Ditylenchus dipsaci TaxID=166011 RepID=A0A915D3N7_9BILA